MTTIVESPQSKIHHLVRRRIPSADVDMKKSDEYDIAQHVTRIIIDKKLSSVERTLNRTKYNG
jgi:hypothetical protein